MRTALSALVFALILGGGLYAQSNGPSDHSKAIDQILSTIRTQMQLGPNDKIDPDKVPSQLMVQLGDAVMDVMIPDEQQHQWMDQMMGGEDSASLDSMHTWIAYRYLTGGYSAVGAGYGMMGGGMGGYSMMGYGNTGWGMMGNPDVPYSNDRYTSPQEIAKRRYAQGQITREQYQQILNDLKK